MLCVTNTTLSERRAHRSRISRSRRLRGDLVQSAEGLVHQQQARFGDDARARDRTPASACRLTAHAGRLGGNPAARPARAPPSAPCGPALSTSPARSRGRRTLRSTLAQGISVGLWNTKASRWRGVILSQLPGHSATLPRGGLALGSRCMRSSVLLPQPEGPSRVANSPSRTCRSMAEPAPARHWDRSCERLAPATAMAPACRLSSGSAARAESRAIPGRRRKRTWSGGRSRRRTPAQKVSHHFSEQRRARALQPLEGNHFARYDLHACVAHTRQRQVAVGRRPGRHGIGDHADFLAHGTQLQRSLQHAHVRLHAGNDDAAAARGHGSSIKRASPTQEKSTFGTTGAFLERLAQASSRCGPRPCGYCSDATTGTSQPAGDAHQPHAALQHCVQPRACAEAAFPARRPSTACSAQRASACHRGPRQAVSLGTWRPANGSPVIDRPPL